MRVAVAGTGAFGRNHLRVYRELQQADAGVELAAAVEPDPGRAAGVEAQYSIPVFATVEELLKSGPRIDAASVAVPTIHHHAVAAQLLDAGLDVLVEKPICATLSEADDLVARAEKASRILQVGHLERFNPAVMAVQPRLKRPMFFEAHRLSVFTPRSLDVDVVLDLMIHDLDIVLTFANSPVREVRAVGLPILSPKVDIANVRVEFESGCVANFTASRVSTERVRKLRFFEPRQYVSIDYARRELLVIRIDDQPSAEVPPQLAAAAVEYLATGRFDTAMLQQLFFSGQIPAPLLAQFGEAKGDPEKIRAFAKSLAEPPAASGPAPGLSFAKPEVTPGEPLRLEIESFLDSVRTRREPRVTARQGRSALALALEIQNTMAAHAHRAGLADFYFPA
ncbi:Gfo/Idh/MocA family protein [Occallatibacter riparius]|uniref:Gfo/Idh/MocA family oxidoreductase n=1 Tax=Occallatibacter riparius TaxID=1002689 RepID=A0A9J7BTZ2_9BACT|nr:Gfo/Idh/MocA family oxidoreductase [Occallatibacter riparius]UWZ86103.1 Gfo/Idh/MocA family oxidoreductase [Occallatibacter riparius]